MGGKCTSHNDNVLKRLRKNIDKDRERKQVEEKKKEKRTEKYRRIICLFLWAFDINHSVICSEFFCDF